MQNNILTKTLAGFVVLGLAACGPGQDTTPMDDPAAETPATAPAADPTFDDPTPPPPPVDEDTVIVEGDAEVVDQTDEPAAY